MLDGGDGRPFHKIWDAVFLTELHRTLNCAALQALTRG